MLRVNDLLQNSLFPFLWYGGENQVLRALDTDGGIWVFFPPGELEALLTMSVSD
jgi:hypothetical protein